MKLLLKSLALILALTFICSSVVSCNESAEGAEGAENPSKETAAEETTEASVDGLVIAKDGKSEFSVWVEERVMADTAANTAVKELILAIKDKTGVELKLINDKNYTDGYGASPAILIGKTKFSESKNAAALEKDVFRIEASGNKLLIIAGDVQGYPTAIGQFTEKIVGSAKDGSTALVFKDEQAFSGSYTVKLSAAEELALWIEESRKTADHDSMKKLTVNILGDSLLKGQTLPEKHIWHGLIAEKYDWSLNNYAQNGCALATGSTCPYGTPMVDRFDEMPDNDADLIILDGGRNDYTHNVPIGTIDSTDKTTFMGALNVMIDGLKQKYPNATIMFISVWNFPDTNDVALSKGITYLDYANAAEAVCAEKGVHFFRSYDKSVSGVDMRNDLFRATYCLKPTDISHLNLEGMKLVMPKFEAFIAEIIQKDKQK